MPLESGIYKPFIRDFVVDEDALRRIEGILQTAAQKYDKELQLVYHVERVDDRFYETQSLEDVLGDPNVGNKQIQQLRTELRSIEETETSQAGSRNIVRVIFDKENDPPFKKTSVFLRITSENRTWALLLADELEPQINRTFKARKTPRFLLYLFVLPFGLIFLKIVRVLGEEQDGATIGVLLGMIVVFILLSPLLLSPLFARMFGRPGWFTRYFGPESAFLWGDELQEYANRDQIRRNIQWVIIVGFFVSFSASIAGVLI